jgi:hypothetical protein
MALVVGAVSPALGSSNQGSASTASGHADKQRTIRVLAVFTEFDANIDVGAPGFSLGDEVVFSGNLLRNGEQVGRVGVVCTFVSTANVNRVEAQCPTTSIFPDGQITTQGTIVNRSLNFTLPITGGSGRYQGAGGQVVSRDVSTPTQPQAVSRTRRPSGTRRQFAERPQVPWVQHEAELLLIALEDEIDLVGGGA